MTNQARKWYKKWWVISLICIPLALIILLFSLHFSITGNITNVVNGLPIQGVEVGFNNKTVKTDINGKFSFSNLPFYFKGDLFVNVQNKYEKIKPIKVSFAKRNEDLEIQLVPRPLEMQKIYYNYIKHKQYSEDYNLLHPDMQARVSRKDYIDYMAKSVKNPEGFSQGVIETSLGKCEYGKVKLLPIWEYKEINESYSDVAVIQYSCSVTVQTTGGEKTLTGKGTSHWVKSGGGYWRLFLNPVVIKKINKGKSSTGVSIPEMVNRLSKDARIDSAISQSRAVMSFIGSMDDSYKNFSCEHEEMTKICQDVKNQSPDGKEPTIKQSKEGACIYSRLNAKDNYWYCADSRGVAGFIDSSGGKPAPGDLGFCDGKTFICPPPVKKD